MSPAPIATPTPDRQFGTLLRRYREVAVLSQEALAERAGMSARAISYLENGTRRPYPDTLHRLAEALSLTPDQREALVDAVRAAAPPTTAPSDHAVHRAPLPVPPTPLIGRVQEVADLTALLHARGARLVTLTGPGGAGKTRLALALATTLTPFFPDGALFVPLAPLTDPELVLPAIAAALGVTTAASESPMQRVQASLREQRLLLVLDNFEQITAAAPEIADLLAACPGLAVIVTSRAVLHLRGEHEFPVPPLALPDLQRLPLLDALARYDAIRLFLERAREVRPDFVLTLANAGAVVEICQRLDGLPLAIELAAARTRALTPTALVERLGKRLEVLTGGARDLPARQRTLRAAIDWSHSLLGEEEQTLFRRLAVFAGGWTLDAAEIVRAPDDGRASDVLDGIEALVGQSLVRRTDGAEDEPRYGMLETIREYASARLAASEDATAVRARYVAYYLELSEMAAPHLQGPEQGAWLTRLAREDDNLRGALAVALEAGETERVMRMASALAWYWRVHGHYREGRGWLTAALAQGSAVAAPVRARAFDACVTLALHHGDYAAARRYAEESLALYRGLGDERGIANVLNSLGVIAMRQGEYPAARRSYEQSLGIQRVLGNQRGIADCLTFLGMIALQEGAHATSRQYEQEGLAIYRELGDLLGSAVCLNNLGFAAFDEDNYPTARAYYEQSLAIHRSVGHQRGIANLLHNLGTVAREQGDDPTAREHFAQSLTIRRELGDKKEIAESLDAWAALAVKTGDGARAARLFGAASGMRERYNAPRPRPLHRRVEDWIAEARARLAAAAWEAAWMAGETMSEDEAIAYALEG